MFWADNVRMDSDKNRITRLRLRIVGVQCSTCIIPVRKALERTTGIKWVGANVMLDLILVDYDPGKVGADQIVEVVKKAGYTAVPAATI
jgi:copper chaperone CopZ